MADVDAHVMVTNYRQRSRDYARRISIARLGPPLLGVRSRNGWAAPVVVPDDSPDYTCPWPDR